MLEFEPYIRFGVFLGVLVAIGLWEVLAPRRHRVASKTVRWLNNLGIIVVSGLMLRLLFPMLAIGAAVLAEQNGWGVAHQLSLPYLLEILIGILLLDLVIYFQHRIFHKYPLLWRLHRMHHIDPDLDVTSGSRFHPIEIALSMLVKMGVVILFGIIAETVLIFEVILNAAAMFNHGNIFIPLKGDKFLRLFVVTPDMHRVHHSVYRDETDSNFGFFLSWWDRWLGTYRAQPRLGHEKMEIGTGQFQESRFLKLNWLLAVPFIKSV